VRIAGSALLGLSFSDSSVVVAPWLIYLFEARVAFFSLLLLLFVGIGNVIRVFVSILKSVIIELNYANKAAKKPQPKKKKPSHHHEHHHYQLWMIIIIIHKLIHPSIHLSNYPSGAGLYRRTHTSNKTENVQQSSDCSTRLYCCCCCPIWLLLLLLLLSFGWSHAKTVHWLWSFYWIHLKRRHPHKKKTHRREDETKEWERVGVREEVGRRGKIK